MDLLKYTTDNNIARISFNRPGSLNAFNYPMMKELRDLLLKIKENSDLKILLVEGEGRAFSAGVDLKATDSGGFQKGADFMALGKEISEILNGYPKVTIAKVHGFCFTGALEFMMFFDMAFCAETTQFGDTHAKWAIMPRWGMTQRLARRVGLHKAKELTFRAMRIDGKEAERIGLVNRAFKDEELSAEVDKIIDEILENSFEAIVAIKKLYDRGFDTTLEEGLQIEANADTKLQDTDTQISKFRKK